MVIMMIFFEIGRMEENHFEVQEGIKDTCFGQVELRIPLDLNISNIIFISLAPSIVVGIY